MTKWIAILAAVVVLHPSGARAEPVTAAISTVLAASSAGAGFFAAVGAGIQALTTSFFGKLLVGAGLSLLSSALQKKPKKVNERGIQTEQTTTGDTTPLKFVVGRYAVEGHALSPAYSRGEKNRILTYILEVSNIPVKGLTGRVIVDGEYTDLTPGNDDPSRLDFSSLGLDKNGFPRGWLWFLDGTQTVAQFKLVEAYSSHPDRPWTTDHKLLKSAYAVCEFPFDREVYSGMPSMRFEVDGIALYDPRKDDTVGGTGAHRWNDTATWEFTKNPQVINYNVMRGITLPTGEIFGGEVPAEDLPLDNWFAAMNECDVLIGGRPQYEAGFEINTNEMEPFDVIEEMNRASFAQMSEFGGVFRVRVGAPSTPVMSLSDDDFVITEASKYEPFPSIEQTINAVTGTYVEPNDVWQGRSADAVTNATWETEDGDRRLMAELNLPAVSNKSQVQQLLNSFVKDERRFRAHRMVLPPSFALLEPLDTISFTSETHGYTNKVFEVLEVEHRPNTLNQSVMVRERDPNDTDWSSSDDVPQPAATNDLTAPADQVLPITVSAVAVENSANTGVLPAIRLTWTPALAGEKPSDLIRYQVRKAASGEIVDTTTVGADEGEAIIKGLANATDYEVRARPVTSAPSDWSAWSPVTTSTNGVQVVDDDTVELDSAGVLRVKNLGVKTAQIAFNSATTANILETTSSIDGTGFPQSVFVGDSIDIPAGETADVFITIFLDQGYTGGARDWGYELVRNFNSDIVALLTRTGMQEVADTPTIAYMEEITNTTSVDHAYEVTFLWEGEDSTLKLSRANMNLLMRMR